MLRSRVPLFAAMLAVGVVVAPASGSAQDEMRKRGDAACKVDANKLCSKFFSQGDMAILTCFQENKVRLTHSCRKFLTEIGQLN